MQRSSRNVYEVQLAEPQLRTLFRIAISASGGSGHELWSILHSISALSYAVSTRADRADSAQHVKDWIARVPPLVDRAENLMRLGMEYCIGGWHDGDPFVTKPAQLLDAIQHAYPETALRVGEGIAQSLDLIYPNLALFTILHELITNAIKHAGKPAQVRIAWHIRSDRFICEIDDNGPGLCKKLSMTYLDRCQLGAILRGGLFTVEETIRASKGSLLFRRSDELGGTQVKIELPLVGYWLDDQLHTWRTVYETGY